MFLDVGAVERKYKKELESIEEWNYLRNYYREVSRESVNKKKQITIFSAVKDAFYGFSNWFKKYDYIVFSDSSERKKIAGKQFDIKVDYLIELLPKNKTLLIETPAPMHYKKEHIYTKRIVSRRMVDFWVVLYEKLFCREIKIKLLDILNSIYKIDFDYQKQINRFNAQYYIYKFLFKFYKPKFIFLNCYYDKQHVTKVAKELHVKVIEIQHGVISSSHSAYYAELNLNALYLPDYLLSFGKNLKEEKSSKFIFNHKNVFPVGNYYLEYLKKNFKYDSKLYQQKSKYRLVVGVSLQWIVENELIIMLDKVANLLTDVLFILIPRRWDEEKYKSMELPENIIFYPKIDCYQTIMHCNYHCTVYSTCALEVPSLGIANILVNVNNLTNKYMYNMFKECNTKMVNTEVELIEILQGGYDLRKESIAKSNEFLFANNYRENIKKIIHKLEEIE